MTYHASRAELTVERDGGHVARATRMADCRVAFEALPGGLRLDESRRPPRWGYLFKGCLRVELSDGGEFYIRAGEAYHLPPGNRVQAIEDTELVEFSLRREHDA